MADEFDQALAAAQLRAKTLTTESIIDGLIEERNEARQLAEYYKDLAEQWFLDAGGDPKQMNTVLPWKEEK
jgi:hypothetical protein